MKASVAIAMANAILATANPLAKRAYVTQLEVKTVTQYVYPDGSPATHLDIAPTQAAPAGAFVYYQTVAAPEAEVTEPVNVPETEYRDTPEVEEQTPEPEVAGPIKAPVKKPVTKEPLPVETKPEPKPEPKPQPKPEVQEPEYVKPGPSSSVQSASLQAHNAHRSNHTVPAVSWDSNLAAYAQKLANSCNYEHDMHIGGGGYGQNIAMFAKSDFDMSAAECASRAITRQWYNDEYELYPGYGGEPDMGSFLDWGHFSQIIWEDTKKIGCAIALCNKGTLSTDLEGYFAVCNYSPQGNFKGRFAENVHPATGASVIVV